MRGLTRQPLTAAAYVCLIALALLIITAAASLVDSILLRPLPFNRPAELAAMRAPQTSDRMLRPAELEVETMRAETSPLIIQRATVRWGFMTELQGPAPGQVDLVHYEVSEGFWDLLGVAPLIGRVFDRADESQDVPPAVVGESLWRAHFGSVATFGEVVTVNGFKVRIVGVMPRDFAFPVGANIWTPLAVVPRRPPSFVRMQSGASVAQLAAEFPRLDVHALDRLVRPDRQLGVVSLGVAALLVLVIAVVQLAAADLSRAVAQSAQVWIRKALGASDRRLVADRVRDAGLLTAIATALAWFVLPGALNVLEAMIPREVTRGQALMADARVFMMSALSALGIVITIALLAGHLARCVVVSGAQVSVMGLRQTRRVTWRILAVQFACTGALVYLCGMGLQTFRNVSAVDLGIDPSPLLIARPSGLPTAPRGTFAGVAERIRTRLVAEPGVTGVAQASTFPLATGAFTGTAVLPRSAAFEPITARMTIASSDYFRVLGARFVEGAGFPDRYDPGAVVINETLARSLRPHGPVIGQVLQVTGFRGPIRGIVADIVDRFPEAPREPHAYFMDPGWASQTFLVRVHHGASVPAITTRVAEVVKHESGATEVSVVPMGDYVRRAMAPHRMHLTILLGLGMLGVVLAGAGVTVSLLMTVRQRTREIGLLFALGADASDVRSVVTRASVRAAAVGSVGGVVAGGALAQLMRSLFVGVPPVSMFAIGFTIAALVLIAVVAALVPVMIAARITPSQALKV